MAEGIFGFCVMAVDGIDAFLGHDDHVRLWKIGGFHRSVMFAPCVVAGDSKGRLVVDMHGAEALVCQGFGGVVRSGAAGQFIEMDMTHRKLNGGGFAGVIARRTWGALFEDRAQYGYFFHGASIGANS